MKKAVIFDLDGTLIDSELFYLNLLLEFLKRKGMVLPFEKACKTVFAEPPVDDLYLEKFDVTEGARVFSVEFLPGQFDQRADSAVQCVQFLDENAAPIIRSATTYVIEGNVTDA